MATDYFQGFLSVLQFCSHLIGIKYGLRFPNHVKIKILFIYWKTHLLQKIYIKKAFLSQNVDETWFINAGLKSWWQQWLGHCVVTVNFFLNGHYYSINGKILKANSVINNLIRNKVSEIPVKNHEKKPKGFLNESETNLCKITRN